MFACLLFLLSGCLSKSAEDLYALPQLSASYLQIQEKIDAFLDSGAEYSAPTSGSYRQAVQVEDLDGDGIKEVLAFLSVPGSDKPQKIYIFRNANGKYEQAAQIEGEGSSIGSVNYIDMDNDGFKEMTVGWQIAAGINMLSVYSLRDFQVTTLISTDYSQCITGDINGNERTDVVVVRLSAADLSGEVEIFSLNDDGEVVNSKARLSAGIEALTRVRSGRLSDGWLAVFVESSMADGAVVTDIFTLRNDRFNNITLDETSGVSKDTIRSYKAYCRDMDGDGKLDVPKPIQLPSQSESSSYYIIEWYSYSSTGSSKLVCTTYSNYSDSWLLTLPSSWRDRVTVRREDSVSGERAIVFSSYSGDIEDIYDFLTIYTLSGDNRYERANAGNRFIILSEEETIYAAEIISEAPMFGVNISEDFIKNNFKIIYSEWITGET